MNRIAPQAVFDVDNRSFVPCSDSYLDEFLSIRSLQELNLWAARYTLLYANQSDDGITLTAEDYYGMRDMMFYAAKLRKLCLNPPSSFDEIPYVSLKQHVWPFYKYDAELSNIAFPVARIPIRGENYKRHLAQMLLGEWFIGEPQYTADFFDENCGETGSHSFIIEDDTLVYVYPVPNHPDWVPGGILDSLMDLHAHVRTCFNDGANYQSADYGLGALWLALSNVITQSKIVVCKACGRPIFVQGQRGQEREYCDEACRSWLRKHPGQEYQHTPRKQKLLK